MVSGALYGYGLLLLLPNVSLMCDSSESTKRWRDLFEAFPGPGFWGSKVQGSTGVVSLTAWCNWDVGLRPPIKYTVGPLLPSAITHPGGMNPEPYSPIGP